jgi:nucleosome assembly protein 1-like 1
MSVESAGDNIEDFEEFDDEEIASTGEHAPHMGDELGNVRDPTEVLKSLSAPVRRKVKALKKLQRNATFIEAKFFEDVHNLECRYHKMYLPLYNKRSQIVTGTYEPNDEECDFPDDEEGDTGNTNSEPEKDCNDIGIPDFWLTILKNAPMTSELVYYYDEPILKNLKDVRSVILDKEPMGFVIEFHFAPNEFFSNQILTKTYEMKCSPDDSDPFSFEGPEIYKCKGCVINWFKGKDVTTKTVKKKQKHKSLGTVRTVVKTVKNDSFFNFFSPPTVENEEEEDDDIQAALANHFELGHYLSERVIPRAVLYFTGEAQEDAYMEEETESESSSAESSDEACQHDDA